MSEVLAFMEKMMERYIECFRTVGLISLDNPIMFSEYQLMIPT